MAACTELCSTLSCVLAWIDAHAAVIIAAMGVVVAMIALSFTFWQISVSRTHNEISVRPKLVFYTDPGEDRAVSYVTLSVRNYGLGPAFLSGIEYSFEGKRFNISDADERLAITTQIFSDRWSQAIPLFELHGTYAIPKDGVLNLARVETQRSPHRGDDPLDKIRKVIGVVVKYTDPYKRAHECRWPETDQSRVLEISDPAA